MLSEHNCIKKFKCRQSVKLQYQFLCSLRVNILWQMYCVNNFVEMDAGARKQYEYYWNTIGCFVDL